MEKKWKVRVFLLRTAYLVIQSNNDLIQCSDRETVETVQYSLKVSRSSEHAHVGGTAVLVVQVEEVNIDVGHQEADRKLMLRVGVGQTASPQYKPHHLPQAV